MNQDSADINEGDHDGVADPFSSEYAPGISLIVQMRIYDMLCGIYSHLEPDKAAALMQLHAEGGIFASLPHYNG